MTFTEIVTEVAARLNLTSSESTTRVGRTVNTAYRKITTAIGLNVSRHFQASTTAGIGTQLLTFTNVEKINSVIDKVSGANRFLDEVSLTELEKAGVSDSDSPTKYAIYRSNAGTVQIKTDVTAQTAYTLYAAGFERASTLSGAQEPAFPESFHDIIVEGTLYEEYLKLEKPGLAKMAKDNYEDRMGDLRIFIAKSPQQDIYVGKTAGTSPWNASVSGGAGGGGGSVVDGTANYTQSGMVVFDRSGAAPDDEPFTVVAGSNMVPNLIVNAGIMTITSQAQGDLLYASSATAWARLAKNATATRYLSNTGATNNPAWAQINLPDGVTGDLPDANLSANVPLLNAANVFSAANTFTATGNNFDEILAVDKGLQFPAVKVASAGANVLDDYEEGTWTPADGSGAGLALTVTSARKNYTGNKVFVQTELVFPATADVTAVKFSGLPETSAIASALVVGFCNQGAISIMAYVRAATATVELFNAITGAAVTNANMSAKTICFAGEYTV